MYDNGSGPMAGGMASGILPFTGLNLPFYLSLALILLAVGLIMLGIARRTRSRHQG